VAKRIAALAIACCCIAAALAACAGGGPAAGGTRAATDAATAAATAATTAAAAGASAESESGTAPAQAEGAAQNPAEAAPESDQEPSDATAGAAAGAADGAASPIGEFATISYYLQRPIDNMAAQEDVEREANRILKEKLNCELKFYPIDRAAYNDKMRMMSAAGEEYDIVFTTTYTNPLQQNVANGALLPLDDLLRQYGSTILEKNDPRAWAAATFNGKIMTIPGESPHAQPSAIVFKADLADKYGLDYKAIHDLKGLEPYLKTLKENEPDITPLFINISRPVATLEPSASDLSVGITFDENTEQVSYAIDTPFNKDIYKTLWDYYQQGYIAMDALVRTETSQEIKSGKYGVFNDMGGYTEDGSKSTGMFGFPCYESLYLYPIINTNSMLGPTNAISATSKNSERAMMLLDLVWSDRYLSNTMAYGIEGKNYTVVSGDIHDPSVDTVVEATSGAEQTWAIWHNWIGPLWDQWSSNWNTTAALKAMQEDNLKSPTSKILGFTFDPEPVKQEVAQFNAIMAEALPVLYTGSAPDVDAYLSETLQKIEDAGGASIIAEIERQIADWRAANQ
jgi:putative aldouronate transport system substrate-binding protein